MDLASYGDLAVRLVNTADPSRPEHDALVDAAGLEALLGDRESWRRLPRADALPRLRALRERLRRIVEDAAGGNAARAVRELNVLLAAAPIRPQVTGHDRQPWHLHVSEGAHDVVEAYSAAAVMGLAVQLTELGPDRFGVCSASGCRHVFVDTSTNRSRRYCSERCATRANVAAYRARRRAAG